MKISQSTKQNSRSFAAIGCWGVRFLMAFAFVLSLIDNVKAQITPDNTLGNEASVVNPNGNIRGLPGTLIEGGAVRGANVFQSFSEFNVGNSQRVYFANPTGIENILTRVTGNNPSNILGTLGVNGAANLFFINPNGIFFGNGARLDITGSFFASTANSLVFNNGLRFSATNPEAPPLLTVKLRPGLQYGKGNSGNIIGNITNQGNLTVTENLTLAGGNLDLQGQLQAGKDLTLQAEDTVKVRDSNLNPFIASAGGKLLIQGNQGIDIFALSNNNSGFFSRGDMVLRSNNTIGGDGRFNTGANFRIEKLDGSLGNLYSPHDPIIQATGDVSGASYTGASLHILAGGEVEISDFVLIQGSDPANGLVENVTLSDGTRTSINGQIEPTLDVRAGTTAIDTTASDTGAPTSGNIRIGTILFADASSDFNTGQIIPLTGKVLLTNQYQPNPSLRGDIQVSNIFGGSLVSLDSRGAVSVNGNIITSPFVTNNAFSVNGGDVKILANSDITFGNSATVNSSGLLGGNITLRSGGKISIPGGGLLSLSYGNAPNFKGGDINVTAQSLDLSDGAQISASTFGRANAGNVTVDAKTIDIDGVGSSNNLSSGIVSSVAEIGVGKAGGIQITTDNLRVTNGGQIGSSTFGKGNAGNITITANDTVSFSGVTNGISSGAFSNVQGNAEGDGGNVNVTAKSLSLTDGGILTASTFAQGKAGGIQITTDNLRVTNGGQIGSSTFGKGNAGNITITANDTVSFSGVTNGISSGAFSNVQGNAEGDGGNVNVTAKSLSLTDGGILNASTFAQGDAGNVTVNAQTIDIDGVGSNNVSSSIRSEVQTDGVGKGGEIKVTTDTLRATNGGQIRAFTFGKGDAGNVTVGAKNIEIDGVGSNNESSGIRSDVTATGIGKAGEIQVTTDNLRLTNGGTIASSTFNQGDAGNVTITATDNISISGVGSNTFSSGAFSNVQGDAVGNGGNVNVTAKSLSLTDGGILNASTFAQGDAGNVTVNAQTIDIDGVGNNDTSSSIRSEVQTDGVGKGGEIQVTTDNLRVNNGGQIRALTFGQGNAGNVTVGAKAIDIDGVGSNNESSGIRSDVAETGIGKAGGIQITTDNLRVTNGGQIGSSTFGKGDAGNVTITATDNVSFSSVSTNTFSSGAFSTVQGQAVGNGGNVNVTAKSLSLTDGGVLNAATFAQGDAGNITVDAKTIDIDGVGSNNNQSGIRSDVTETGIGKAGGIDITTDNLRVTNGGVIASATFNQGDAGDVTITATDTVSFSGVTNTGFSSGAFSTVQDQAVGNGGNVNVTAKSLSLTDGGSLSASTFGKGDAGNISVELTDFLTLANSARISTGVGSGAEGDSGNISIKGRSLSISNGSQIGAFVFRQFGDAVGGRGNGGEIRVDIKDDINISGVNADGFSSGLLSLSERGAFGKAGDINITGRNLKISDGAIITAGTFNDGGVGGNITINAQNFEAINGGQIVTNTRSSQNAGNIRLNVKDKITIAGRDQNFDNRINSVTDRLNRERLENPQQTDQLTDVIVNEGADSGLFTNTSVNSSGNGGSIFIYPKEITIRDGGKIAVGSEGSGNSGNINLQANKLRLENQGLITADTASSLSGGNITLDLRDLLLLRGNSQITSSAGNINQSGTGGNININTPFIVAFENSDIIANAFRGSGGKVNINALRLFGISALSRQELQSRLGTNNPTDLNPRNLPTSDITAISQESPTLSGQVNINDFTIDPTQGVNNLPENITDNTRLIDQGCTAFSNKGSEFIVTGRGGLPPNPNDPLTPDAIWEDTRIRASAGEIVSNRQNNQNHKDKKKQQQTSEKPTLHQATGWIFNSKGEVFLVGSANPYPHPVIKKCTN